MPSTRRSVKGDENNWIETQSAVFRNWVNQNLSTREMEVEVLETGFADGIKLINLYEVVAKKKLGRYNKKPKLPNQMLENVTLALKAMEDDGINLLSIDSEHIVNGSLKLILGLIWRMILHYQIGAMTIKIPVKKLVLLWVQNVIPVQEITNLTQDWNNGIALCSLVESVKPGTCPQYAELQPQNKVENCDLGLTLAKDELGIPRILTAEQMADPNIDEQSMMTYLSYFIQDDAVGQEYAKELVASWSNDITFSNFSTDWNDGMKLCTLVESIRPGTIPELNSLSPENKLENATLGMNQAEKELGVKKLFKPEDLINPDVPEVAVMAYLLQFRKVAVPVRKPAQSMRVISIIEETKEEEPIVVFEIEKQQSAPVEEEIFEVAEKPVEQEVGIDVETFIETYSELQKDVDVETFIETYSELQKDVDIDLFSISGTGLTDPQIDQDNEFYIRCDESFDENDLHVTVTAPGLNAGDDDRVMPISKEKANDRLVVCRYPLDTPGLYTIDIKYKEQHLNHSPISIKIVQDLTRVTVSGSGLGEVFINEPAEINLETGLDNAQIHAYSVSPEMSEDPATVIDQGDGNYLIKYVPHQVGLYGLFIIINGENLPGCPYVARAVDAGSVVVTSTQRKNGQEICVIPDEPVSLSIDVSRSGPGTVTATTSGPHNSETPTDILQKEDGSVAISFTPPTVGVYHTDIFWNNRKIHGCPFTIFVSDPGKCVAHGEGLYRARLNEAAQFEVTTIGAGPGNIHGYAKCHDEEIPIELSKSDENSYSGQYYPDSLEPLAVYLDFNGTPIRGSPFTVSVGNPNKCNFHVIDEKPVKVDSEYSLSVEFGEDAGHGDVTCIVKSPCGVELPVMIIDNGHRSKRIHFKPKQAGVHEVKVCFAGAALAGCPYNIEVLAASDASKVVASGDGLHQAPANEISRVRVDCKNAGKGELSASVNTLGTNVLSPVAVKSNDDDTYDVTYSVPSAGSYELAIKYDDSHIPGSPFIVTGYNRTHPEQVVVSGAGLKEGTAGQPVMFTLDGRNAGVGQLSCRCKSPLGNDTAVLISDNKDGTFTVDLNAKEAGVHAVDLEWDGKPIPGSPFMVRIMQAPDVGKVKVHGPGLRSGLLSEYQGKFTVETKGAGPGTLKVRIHGPKGAFKVQMSRESNKERMIGVLYNPTEPGQYTVNVLWSDQHAQGSPFQVMIAENKQQLAKMLDDRGAGYESNAAGGQRINGYDDKRV